MIKPGTSDLPFISTANTINTKGEPVIWFWNKSANKTNSKKEKEENSNLDEMNLEGVKSRTEKAINAKIQKIEIK